jgi:hypothetical protein
MPIYLGNTEIGSEYVDSYQLGRIYQGTQIVQGGYSIDNGAYAYYDASNPTSYPGSGSTWYDISGNNNNLTFTGSVTYSTGSLAFSGSYATKESASLFTGSLLTVCGWVNYTNIVAGGAPKVWVSFDTGVDETPQYYIGRQYLTSTTSRAFINTNQGTILNNNNTTNILNNWIFYSFVTSGSTPSYPVNTILSGSEMPQYYEQGFITTRTSDTWEGGAFSMPRTRPNINIAGLPSSGNDYNFVGKIGIVAIYDKVLSSSSILDFYEATKGKYGY